MFGRYVLATRLAEIAASFNGQLTMKVANMGAKLECRTVYFGRVQGANLILKTVDYNSN